MLALALLVIGAAPVEVEQRVDAAAFEVALFPAAVQLNAKFTQHVGTFGSVTWRWKERFGFQLLGGGNWFSNETRLTDEFVEKFNVEPQAATAVMWTWGVFGGFEVIPFVAEFHVFDGVAVRAGVTVSAALGAGGTRRRLLPGVFADTGARLMGAASVGARVELGRRFTLRLDVRDVLYGSRVETVNGCTLAPSCENFSEAEAAAARALITSSTTDILNNVGLYVGAGFMF